MSVVSSAVDRHPERSQQPASRKASPVPEAPLETSRARRQTSRRRPHSLLTPRRRRCGGCLGAAAAGTAAAGALAPPLERRARPAPDRPPRASPRQMESPFDALAPVHSIHRANSSGIRPSHDTYPIGGIGGVVGTGEGAPPAAAARRCRCRCRRLEAPSHGLGAARSCSLQGSSSLWGATPRAAAAARCRWASTSCGWAPRSPPPSSLLSPQTCWRPRRPRVRATHGWRARRRAAAGLRQARAAAALAGGGRRPPASRPSRRSSTLALPPSPLPTHSWPLPPRTSQHTQPPDRWRSRLPRAWWEAWTLQRPWLQAPPWSTTAPPGRSASPPTEARRHAASDARRGARMPLTARACRPLPAPPPTPPGLRPVNGGSP